MIVPVSAAALIISPKSTWYGSRDSKRRPLGWPRMVTYRFSIARMMRLVISFSGKVNEAWTLATT